MKTDFFVLFVIVGAMASIALYVLLLYNGVKLMHTPEATKLRRVEGYILVIIGICALGIGVGLYITVQWALMFNEAPLLTSCAIAYCIGTLIAVVYTHFKDPKYKKVQE